MNPNLGPIASWVPTGPHVNTCFYSVNGLQLWMEEKEILTLSPYDNFLYALKAETTKRQYPNRLDRFLSFVGLEGSIQQKCNALYEISKNKEVLYSHLIRFINSQKVRIQNKEISEATLGNYVKTIKLFCSMNDIIINWKKISKGMPPVKKSNLDSC